MKLLNIIKECFASLKEGNSRLIEGIDYDYLAYAIRIDKTYGVGIPVSGEIEYNANFTKARIETKNFCIDGKDLRLLFLSSTFYGLREEFALVCYDFINPGKNGEKREQIIKDPDSWSSFWSDLLGNTKKTKKIYDVIAEMATLLYIHKTDKSAKWTGSKGGTHDIESKYFSCEVKSSLMKYDNYVTISSQHQLESSSTDKPVKLSFCKVESNPYGQSIEDYVKLLEIEGYDVQEIEDNLKLLGIGKGKKERYEKYIFLDKRFYLVDDNFPKLNFDSIKDEKVRSKLIKIVYTIDLTGMENEKF